MSLAPHHQPRVRGGPATNCIDLAAYAFELAPTMALVLRRIRLPVCSASPSRPAAPWHFLGAGCQPYPSRRGVAEDHQVQVEVTPSFDQRGHRAATGDYTPSARGGTSPDLDDGASLRRLADQQIARHTRYRSPSLRLHPLAARAIAERRGTRIDVHATIFMAVSCGYVGCS